MQQLVESDFWIKTSEICIVVVPTQSQKSRYNEGPICMVPLQNLT